MRERVKFAYSFESKAKLVDKENKQIQQHEKDFENHVKPVMLETERRKSHAQEKAAQIRISKAR
jgi:hypothetical protein